jgi:hypothetical protein
VDTGHHYQSQNIEQIVAWLLSEDMLGGFHFNDRRYADDDLTTGRSIRTSVPHLPRDPLFERNGGPADIAYMIDQSHNLKGKIEAMVQTIVTAQALYAKAALVDLDRLAARAGRQPPGAGGVLSAGRLCHRRAADDCRVAHSEGPSRRSTGCAVAERLRRADHRSGRSGGRPRRPRGTIVNGVGVIFEDTPTRSVRSGSVLENDSDPNLSRGIHKSFAGVHALKGVSFALLRAKCMRWSARTAPANRRSSGS